VEKDCTKVIEEWWTGCRQSFRLGASGDCLQLQSYAIVIDVVADVVDVVDGEDCSAH